jgi:hypothetical protein
MELEQQYQGLIDRLKARILPREHVDKLTVGAGFEDFAVTLMAEIGRLKKQESVLIRIFLISSVDLGKTARVMQRGFEFQIMKGLHSPQHLNYQEVFAEAYNRIMQNYKQQNPQSSNLDARNFVRNLLMTIVSGAVVTVSVSGGAAIPGVGLAALGSAPAL